MEKDERLILVDADVIVHLFKAERLSLLQELFPKRILLLDVVYNELLKNPILKDKVQNLIIFKQANLFAFPTSNCDILNEYNRLRNSKGEGESACMAVCRYKKNILASSNLLDIKTYCQQHSIEYVTTMDILAIAYKKGKITVAEADLAIYDIKTKGSRLPKFDKIEDYISREFDKEKLKY